MRKLYLLLILFLFAGCGEGIVEVDDSLYEPKLSIHGVLFPGQPVDKIFITRNFRVNEQISINDIIIKDAVVNLMEKQSGQDYPIIYDPSRGFYYYPGNDLTIEPGKSYELSVSATVAGKDLLTSSTTTVPQIGMDIVGSNHDSLQYRQSNGNGDLTRFAIEFERSPGIDFYLFSTFALEASVESYVYGNPYDDLDEEDVREDLIDLSFEYEWYLNMPTTPGRSTIELFWIEMPFYGTYQVIGYALDENYENFMKTYDDVQEDDGNFHAPKISLAGDGIGVFGSAISDTTYVTVTGN
ncbi:MAG: DUF4249 family protein [Calditrichota bacterium]